ncbi:hypothetical protein [Protofrankia coriariae]|uniref:JAB domain-containing protein n=1 Tax=Protofrankia coriariae TaxID=1562887 RepID=A0ABR5F2B1_9ACTN|nr:hypothetical protein [Protofrankia coriariae]KLL10788.1 hypothetical protein FrCorBMG51_15290 [Protofrankia coriariae]
MSPTRCVVRVPETVWRQTRRYLFDVPVERMAYLLGHASEWTDPWGRATTDIFVRYAIPVPDDALTLQTSVRVEVDHTLTRAVLRECYECALSLIDVHTHPFADRSVWFSGHDEANMRITHADFSDTIPSLPPVFPASLVLGQRSVAGMWRNPSTGVLETIDELRLLGRSETTVELVR